MDLREELLRIVAPRLQEYERPQGNSRTAKGSWYSHADADLRNPSGSLGLPA